MSTLTTPNAKRVGRRLRRAGAVTAVLVLAAGTAVAATPVLNQFTQPEIDTNWEADRFFPTDGATSVAAFGRNDVARLGVDSAQTQPGTFQRTEGIKTVGDQNFGLSVHVELYVDPDWENKAVRAGFWVVGDNGLNARDNLFAILEFVNLEPSTSGASAQGDHEGWRYWASGVGWTDLHVPFAYGEWVTLGIELDPVAKQYLYSINGTQVATATGGENFIRELFLNSYNYGLDVFPNLSNDSYAAHWHAGVLYNPPTSKKECKKGGWATFENPSFKNQGDCVSFVASEGKKAPKGPKK